MLEKKLKGIFLNPVFGSFRRYFSLAALVGASITGCSGGSNSVGKADAVASDTSAWGSGFSQENNSPDTYSTLKETKSNGQYCYKDQDGDKIGDSNKGILYAEGECPSGYSNENGDCDDNPKTGKYIQENCLQSDAIVSSSDADVSIGIDALIDIFNNKYIVEITAGYWHACARTSTNDVYCWGYNGEGGLGNDDKGTDSNVPVKVKGLEGYTITQLSAGAYYTCTIADTFSDNPVKGVVLCWGNMFNLGENDPNYEKYTNIINSTVPKKLEGLDGIVATQLATGGNHMLVLTDEGTYALGTDHWGAVDGDGTIVTIPTLVKMAGTGLEGKFVTGVAASASGYASFFTVSDGTGYVLGTNFYGILGIGEKNIDNFTQTTPVQIKYLGGKIQDPGYLGNLTKISTKMYSVFGLLDDGQVVFWGPDDTGSALQGNNNFQSYLEPILVGYLVEGEKVTQISCGGGHAFITLSNGQTGGSGYNGYGQLGTNSTTDVYSKDAVGWLYGGNQPHVKQVAAGIDFTLILLDDGSVQFMGRGEHGEGGNKTTDNAYFPTPVEFPTD